MIQENKYGTVWALFTKKEYFEALEANLELYQ